MVQPVTVGLDIAKNVFHAYGVDANGEKVVSRKLRRAQVEVFFGKLDRCLVGIEACATAHHWARTIEKLGHEVRLMPPAYVKPYVKTQKNDERMPRQSAKRLPDATCGLQKQRRSNSKACWCCIEPEPC